ncbi:MAG: ROK family protein [Synergistaceae bacterium]|jgi:glucokinase|nr:ROK family protein [Synergistaceae bacterium]
MRIGVDLGGHTLITALVSEPVPGELPRIERVDTADTPPGRGVSDIMNAITGAAERLADGKPISSIGIAVPGMLDSERRHSRRLPNFPLEWDNLDIPAALGEALKQRRVSAGRISIENDANCYALGEGLAGEAVGLSDYVAFTLGTGIGCGIVAGGKLLTGANGMAGEGGHLVVSGDAPCGCGGKGHSETIAAADGTTKRALAKGLPSDFRALWSMRGAREADEVIGATLDAMARTIASACHLLDPKAVIIGGGMSKAEGIMEALRDRTTPYLSHPFKKILDLRISRLGNEAALYGAAGLQ